MKTTAITPVAEPVRVGGRAAASARVGISAPSGLFAAMTAVAGLAAGRRLIRKESAASPPWPTPVNAAVAALLRNAGARLARRGRGTVEYEIMLARGPEESEACGRSSSSVGADGKRAELRHPPGGREPDGHALDE